MNIKEKVSKIHQKITQLGYLDFKRTHAQEVLAVALGYNNYHAMKSKLDVKTKVDNSSIEGYKKFLIKTDSSTGDDYKRIESMCIEIPMDIIVKINKTMGLSKFDYYDQITIKTSDIKLKYLESDANILNELWSSPMIGIGLEANKTNSIKGMDDDEDIEFSVGHVIHPDDKVHIVLDKMDNHKFMFTHTYKYETVLYEAFFDLDVLNTTPVIREKNE